MTDNSTRSGVYLEYPAATHVRVTFHPQLWIDDRAVTGTDTETYLVPIEKALTDDSALVADNTSASDQLAWVTEAPDRARNWQGPFYITVGEILNENERGDRDEKTSQESI